MEAYTGAKMDASTPGVRKAVGIDAVEPMTELPAELSRLMAADRTLEKNVWTQPESAAAKALLEFTAVALGTEGRPQPHDVTSLTMQLRQIKDAARSSCIKKASAASITGAARDDAVVGQAGHDRARRRRQR